MKKIQDVVRAYSQRARSSLWSQDPDIWAEPWRVKKNSSGEGILEIDPEVSIVWNPSAEANETNILKK